MFDRSQCDNIICICRKKVFLCTHAQACICVMGEGGRGDHIELVRSQESRGNNSFEQLMVETVSKW